MYQYTTYDETLLPSDGDEFRTLLARVNAATDTLLRMTKNVRLKPLWLSEYEFAVQLNGGCCVRINLPDFEEDAGWEIFDLTSYLGRWTFMDEGKNEQVKQATV